MRVRCTLQGLALAFLSALPAFAQERPTGIEVAVLPALGFDADEGFAYGAQAEIYAYGDGSPLPYVWTVQPRVYVTTKGRRDMTVFFDAPGLLPGGWRVDAYLGAERKITSPYYGLGNESAYDAALEDPEGPNPHYYTFGRTRRIARMNLQRSIGGSPLRMLFGVGLSRSEIDPVPRDAGSTLYAAERGTSIEAYWTNFVRGGLVWDTRDRETGPRRGTWTELLVQRVDESLGADVGFTRWTLIDRRYFSLGERLVLAHRYLVQGVSGGAPVEQVQRIETSFKEGDGLGGSASVRGVPRNRYTGRGMLAWNTELRWRALDLVALGRRVYLGASAFLDQGRVWTGDVRASELLSDLHRGYGGGLHAGRGENFVASLYLGTSKDAGLKVYMGLGYLF